MKSSPRLSPDRALFVAREWAQPSAAGGIRIKADRAHKLPNAIQYRRAEAVACWDRVTAPVLLVTGRDTNFAAARDWLEPEQDGSGLRASRKIEIPDSGHMVHFEQPAALAAAIEEFLRDL